jgi:hypothetical protein
MLLGWGFLLLCIVLWGCRNDEVPTYPEYEIVLTSPDDGTTIDMSQSATIYFGFNEAPGVNMYVLMLSRQEDMTEPQEWLVTNNPQLLTTADLDAKKTVLGIPTGQTTTLYWSVRPNSGDYNIKMQVRTLQVVVAPVAVTGVTVSPTTKALNVGDTFTATATVQPPDATDKTVTWSSDDETVATVVDGLVTAVPEGEATITATTGDGGHTATVAVTVIAPAGEKAQELAAALGNGNASVSGANVTLTNNISIANVEIPAGVTLVVPAEITLTVTGTLSGTGTITVEGIVDAGTGTFSGTANLLDGSVSRGVVTAPAASSGWVWKFGKLWSDQIVMSGCEGDPSLSTDPTCGSRVLDGIRHYYYNWYYVETNSAAMCPTGWRLPAHPGDYQALKGATTAAGVWSVWGKPGGYTEYNVWGADGALQLWTSTPKDANMYIVYVGAWGIEYGDRNKQQNIPVRCVQD